MIEFSRNSECSFERIMMDNVRNVEVIISASLWSTTLWLIKVGRFSTFYNPHISIVKYRSEITFDQITWLVWDAVN